MVICLEIPTEQTPWPLVRKRTIPTERLEMPTTFQISEQLLFQLFNIHNASDNQMNLLHMVPVILRLKVLLQS
jgi:hypothetical protein